MKNLEIVKILNNIADILEIQGVEFKPNAYRRAARSIEGLAEDIAEVAERGELQNIPGVGESIAEKIDEYIKTGRLRYYEQLKKQMKIDVEALNNIPTLGPKKIKLLYEKLRIRNVQDLKKALAAKELEEVMQRFTTLPDIDTVLAKGTTRGSVRFKSGLQADLRVLKEKEFGSALLDFTGSKDHNITLRKLALRKQW